ncbi:MAG TPA: hypothetical protein VMZ31_13660 [Phycisphaerae bacterium]|nr:hypothetical protein [Phycisphaerae bacterium]
MVALVIACLSDVAILAALPSLAGIYVVCLVVGGGLLLVSTALGGHGHADFDADGVAGVDLDVDADAVDAHADDLSAGHADTDSVVSLATWFSLRFVIYFIAVFGLIGTVLTYMAAMQNAAVLAWAAVAGLVVGQTVHQTLRYLSRTSGDSAVQTSDYLQKPARVTIAIVPPSRGEVAVRVQDRERFVPAVAKHENERFDIGQTVVIASFIAGTADVISQKEHEFMAELKAGDNDG